MDNINEEIKNKMIDKTFSSFENSIIDAKQPRNRFFNVSIVLLNIAVLILATFYVASQYGYVEIGLVFNTLDYRFLCIAIGVYFLMLIVQVIPLAIHIKKKSGCNIFTRTLLGEISYNYYQCVSIYNGCGLKKSILDMTSKCDNKELVLDTKYSQKIYYVIARFVLLVSCVILGAILVMEQMLVWLWIGVVLILLIMFRLILNILFIRNSKIVIDFVGRICRLLYKLKLVKNIDVLYNKIIDRFILNARAFRQDKKFIFISVFSLILNILLYAMLYCCAFMMINNFVAIDFIQLLIGGVILKTIFDVFPTPNGTLIFEILFVLMFTNVYLKQYLFVGLIITRLFVYFLNVIMYIFLLPFQCIKKAKK